MSPKTVEALFRVQFPERRTGPLSCDLENDFLYGLVAGAAAGVAAGAEEPPVPASFGVDR